MKFLLLAFVLSFLPQVSLGVDSSPLDKQTLREFVKVLDQAYQRHEKVVEKCSSMKVEAVYVMEEPNWFGADMELEFNGNCGDYQFGIYSIDYKLVPEKSVAKAYRLKRTPGAHPERIHFDVIVDYPIEKFKVIEPRFSTGPSMKILDMKIVRVQERKSNHPIKNAIYKDIFIQVDTYHSVNRINFSDIGGLPVVGESWPWWGEQKVYLMSFDLGDMNSTAFGSNKVFKLSILHRWQRNSGQWKTNFAWPYGKVFVTTDKEFFYLKTKDHQNITLTRHEFLDHPTDLKKISQVINGPH